VSCPGCPIPSEVDEDITLAAKAAIQALEGSGAVSNCGGISLVKVKKAETQVVAGINYFLSLRLKVKSGQNCEENVEKICKNIVVFKPLPFNCQSEDGCLELTRQEGISCSPTEETRSGGGDFLFSIDTSTDTSKIAQCTGDGKSNCKAIAINKDVVDNLKVGDKVALLPGLDLVLTLKREPTQGGSSTSFVFVVGKHGEATITMGKSAVFGSIKPTEGSVDYTIENCGTNCNVIYERDVGYFNKFND